MRSDIEIAREANLRPIAEVAAGLGLTAAGLMATQPAEAAQQVADLAASDNRFGTIALLAVPVVG